MINRHRLRAIIGAQALAIAAAAPDASVAAVDRRSEDMRERLKADPRICKQSSADEVGAGTRRALARMAAKKAALATSLANALAARAALPAGTPGACKPKRRGF